MEEIKMGGTVRTVNNQEPDDCGNVTIVIPDPVIATEAEATAGADNTKHMTPLRVMQAIRAASVPIGTVIAYAANSLPSGGYILCNGATISRTTYAALYAKIGTTYGAGDGSTTFALPDLTNRFIQGHGTAGTVKAAGLPNITGTFTLADNGFLTGYGFELSNDNLSGAFTSQKPTTSVKSYTVDSRGTAVQIPKFDASRSNAIYGKSSTVQPPSVTMRYYIKY